jgi:hypothetical protein
LDDGANGSCLLLAAVLKEVIDVLEVLGDIGLDEI